MVLAPGITGKDLNPDLLPLKIGRGSATGNLLIVFTTQLDAESRYLTVNKSQFGLYLDDERKRMLLHYDYNRDPTNQYPDAHVQVAGGSRTLTRWCKRSGCTSKELPRLHLPVGGRRFRPTLEDVIEFLIIEELARPRDGWEKVIQPQGSAPAAGLSPHRGPHDQPYDWQRRLATTRAVAGTADTRASTVQIACTDPSATPVTSTAAARYTVMALSSVSTRTPRSILDTQ